jgi:hypothetical protein
MARSRVQTFGQEARLLHLPERQSAENQWRYPCRPDAALPRQQARLQFFSIQSRMLPERTRRKIPGEIHEDARDVARRKMTTKGCASHI